MPDCPTGPFTMLELQEQEIGEFYAVEKRRATDFEDPNLHKGRSGDSTNIILIQIYALRLPDRH